MKKQRNMFQAKEQDKCTEINHEMEISDLFDNGHKDDHRG